MVIAAGAAAWHYIFDGAGSGGGGVADGRWQRDAGCTQGQAGGRARWRADDEAFAVVLDFGLGQRIQIGDDLGPGARATERRNTVLQRRLQHEREKAAEHVTADGLVEFVEDRPSGEQVLGGAEGLLHRPQLLVAEHGLERIEIGVGAQHEDAACWCAHRAAIRPEKSTQIRPESVALHFRERATLQQAKSMTYLTSTRANCRRWVSGSAAAPIIFAGGMMVAAGLCLAAFRL